MYQARSFDISTAPNRYAKTWRNRRVTWGDVTGKIAKAVTSVDKDQGGYVAGYLRDGLRRKAHIEYRSMITLDADTPGAEFLAAVDIELGGHAYVVHETHGSTDDAPRWRLVVPLAQDVSPEQYVPAALALMARIGVDSFDPTTAQPERFMYWPARPDGAGYAVVVGEGDYLDAAELLAEYPDWQDATCWPEIEHAYRAGELKKAGDARGKPGVIGAFNRAHSVPSAISAYLSEVYTQASGGRYTYRDGHATAGLAVYDDDTYAYSNHGTDPASGKLLSAFDLVRVHLFGELDKDVEPGTSVHLLPSQGKMLQLAGEDTQTRVELDRGRHLSALADFDEALGFEDDLRAAEVGLIGADAAAEAELSSRLERNRNGRPLANASNLELIMNLDPKLSGAVGNDLFARRRTVLRDLPWRKLSPSTSEWTDSDDAGLRVYLDKTRGISNKGLIDDAAVLAASRCEYHPVRDYLRPLVWDGKPRVDTLLVDYLGAEDSSYARAVTRKTLVAAVARVMQPGIKFDHVLITTGPQGIGKSMLPARLAGKWFSDTYLDIDSKDAYQGLAGNWVIELGELHATKKASIERVKAYVSASTDTYRAAYARHTQTIARQNIFWGTSNEHEFLRDRTGNRRFWPVKVVGLGERGPWDMSDDDVAQIWAEALHLWDNGETLRLDASQERETLAHTAEHTESSELDGMLAEYLAKALPPEWYTLSIEDRRYYMRDATGGEPAPGMAARDKVCIAEVWAELLGERPGTMPPIRASAIRAALDATDGWQRRGGQLRFGREYGRQTAWVRVGATQLDSD